jgi:Icc-related predicted phosphoesterase
MRIVIISDTHGKHLELPILAGDVLIHCGDFCDGFRVDIDDLRRIDEWFGTLDFEKIIAVGGNHDFAAQANHSRNQTVLENAEYFVDEAIRYQGVNFYGSPWIPDLSGWAYFMPDDQRRIAWEKIPDNTDVLITHTPPLGILDKPRSGKSVGCAHLRARLDDLNNLKAHCFGHIHASYGSTTQGDRTYFNASAVNSNFEIENPPFVFEIE